MPSLPTLSSTEYGLPPSAYDVGSLKETARQALKGKRGVYRWIQIQMIR